VNVDTYTRILFRKSDTELATIRAQAEQVALGAITSISALSQSTTFNNDQALAILDACDRVQRARELNPDACGDTAGDAALGHSVRFQHVAQPQGVTWGP